MLSRSPGLCDDFWAKNQTESCDELEVTVWYPVSAVLTGTGGVMSFTNHLDGEPQHYFRLRVLPP